MTKNIISGFKAEDLAQVGEVVFGVAPYINQKGETTIDATIGRVVEKDGQKRVISDIFIHQNLLFSKVKKNGKKVLLIEEIFNNIVKQVKDIAPYAARLEQQAAQKKAKEQADKNAKDAETLSDNIKKLKFFNDLYKNKTPLKRDAREMEYLRQQIKKADPKKYAKIFGKD